MRAYLVTTGVLFAVITVAHVFEIVDRQRLFVRGRRSGKGDGDRQRLFASDALILAVSVGLSVWAWRLVRKAAA